MDLISELLKLIKINSKISSIGLDKELVIEMILEESLRITSASSAYLLNVSDMQNVNILKSHSKTGTVPLPFSSSSAKKAALNNDFDVYSAGSQVIQSKSILLNSINSIVSIFLTSKDKDFYVLQVVSSDQMAVRQEQLTLLKLFSAQAKVTLDMSILIKNELSAKEQSARYSVARQVAHDIRSPINALNGILPRITAKLNVEDSQMLSEIASRINSIADDLTNSKPRTEILKDLKTSISSILKEKQLDFELIEEKTIEFSLIGSCEYKYYSPKIIRMVSNVFNNSVEAIESYGSISIVLQEDEVSFSISIIDSGKGIDEKVVLALNEDSPITTKEYGNGLGLSSVIAETKNLGGEIKISRKNPGTQIDFKFPKLTSLNEIILIDDDKFIHVNWKNRAELKGIKLTTYYKLEDFLFDAGKFPFSASIYIDSHLGNNIHGEVESKKIYDLGFRNIWVTTSYTDLNLANTPWLQGVINKTPPF